MTGQQAEEKNGAVLAWNASCKGLDRFTKSEPISSRHLLLVFRDPPHLNSSLVTHNIDQDDVRAAQEAINESGDRVSYSELRKELG